ncbi:hypothetical protein FOZ63_001278 [Perkinsus olseni]|uniref:MULE transposase domain-containing protein n=1 Tax=Perkinsus olseni TaxID=32597 RepID=A0A7J6SUK5_PEROL|nr:hypothetical protein FOZ63_001278 [Perkinsus olseni]
MIKCGKNLPLAIDGHFKSCRGSWTLLVIAACVQGVLESGKWGWSTVPLMAALCLNETKRAVEYLLRKLRMVMEGLSDGSFVEPYCILSDASRPITSAVKAVFSKTASQRCAWHTVEACKKAGVILAAGVTRQAYVTFINRAITNSYYNCVACAGQTVYDAYVSLIVIEAAIVFGSDAGVHLRRSLVEEVSTLGRLNGDCPLVGAVASPGAPFQGVPVFNNNLESLFSVLRVAYSERNRKAEGIRNGHRRAADLLYTKPGVEKEGPFCSCAMYAQYGQCIHRELLKLHLEDNDVHCEFEQCGTQFGEDMKIEVAPGLSPPPKRRRQSDRMDPFRSSSSKVAPWPSSQSSAKEGVVPGFVADERLPHGEIRFSNGGTQLQGTPSPRRE